MTKGKANNPESNARKGFASMDEKRQHEIASKGGKAVSKNREHMSQIGKKGGVTVSKDRDHMAEIGRKGGKH
jgi:general stress protein YciG